MENLESLNLTNAEYPPVPELELLMDWCVEKLEKYTVYRKITVSLKLDLL